MAKKALLHFLSHTNELHFFYIIPNFRLVASLILRVIFSAFSVFYTTLYTILWYSMLSSEEGDDYNWKLDIPSLDGAPVVHSKACRAIGLEWLIEPVRDLVIFSPLAIPTQQPHYRPSLWPLQCCICAVGLEERASLSPSLSPPSELFPVIVGLLGKEN